MEKRMSSQHDNINNSLKEHDIQLTAPVTDEQASVITPATLRFVAALAREFDSRRRELLGIREMRQQELEEGRYPDFLHETEAIRDAEWTVARAPTDLTDRRVEILGPARRETIADALDSGANVFVADFEDSSAPTWQNVLQGQVDLRDAVDGKLQSTARNGHSVALALRPRGWHLNEKHVIVDGRPIPASLFDFGVYYFTNARTLLEQNSGAYFYLPKLESHHEAELWNDVFEMAQDALGIPRGTIRVTILIETVRAAFEMDEILFELRHHAVGLASGHWDYLFSFVKSFRHETNFVLPDWHSIATETSLLSSCVELMIHTCHRRGTHAIGGMSAQIPISSDPLANATARQKVRDDKLHEVVAGHDGTLIAHPDLVPIAKEVFDAHMKTPNQIQKPPNGAVIGARDLLATPKGEITENGLRNNVQVAIVYIESWLRGNGWVTIHNKMQDVATAEISRSQVWQWLRHHAMLSDGRVVDEELVRQAIADEVAIIKKNIGEKRYASSRFDDAAKIFERMITGTEFAEFMPLVADGYID